jgi:hypothetical protein
MKKNKGIIAGYSISIFSLILVMLRLRKLNRVQKTYYREGLM